MTVGAPSWSASRPDYPRSPPEQGAAMRRRTSQLGVAAVAALVALRAVVG